MTMKKTTKSILSVLFAIALILSMIPVSAFAAATDTTPAPTEGTAEDTGATDEATDTEATTDTPASEWTAFLMYSAANPADKSWQIYEPEERGAKNTTKFIGDGVYEVSIKASDIGATAQADTANVLCIDIRDFGKVLLDAGKNINNYTDDNASHDISKHFQPTDLTVNVELFVDGKEVSVKQNKYNYGNIEDQGGNFRIELYNEWGLHGGAVKDNPPVNNLAILPKDEIKAVFTIVGTGFNTEEGAKAIADYEASKVTPTPKATPTPVVEASASPAEEEGGNSNGMIIGIAVAAAVVVIIIIIAVVSKKKK